MLTTDKLTTMIMDEYNKYPDLFEDHPIEIAENTNSITITKVLLKNQLNKTVLSLFVSWRNFTDDLYFDDSENETYTLMYLWYGMSFSSLCDVAKAMKNDYIVNKNIIKLLD